jgi:RimJ/RimL family protein N-acetyltransferase
MPVSLQSYRPEHLPLLYSYWCNLGSQIPYFFPVSPAYWQACLLEEHLEGDLIFKHLETWLAVGEDRVLGFIQFGQPNFAWNATGESYPDPEIGVIRHLYFDRDAPDAGRALLAQAESFLSRFPICHAFYHILGMSCNARHGKLHTDFDHVEGLLLESGYRLEHENVYYVLPVEASLVQDSRPLALLSTSSGPGIERFEVLHEGIPAGDARLLDLNPFTGGRTRETVYLTWLWISESLCGKGLGQRFLHTLVEGLRARGFRSLHTDTPSTNLAAQRFYEKFGFQKQGRTRSYLHVELI